MDLTRRMPVWAGMTVYPYSKLNPSRVSGLLKKWGIDRVLVNSSADWGVSDPCSLPKTAEFMRQDGFNPEQIEQVLFRNPASFYGSNDRFRPRLDLPCQDPAQYQR
jgi:predicted metal-dependent TIM-barrel fold hydrolase